MKSVLNLLLFLICLTAQAGEMLPIADWANKIRPLTVGSYVPEASLWTGNGDSILLSKLLHKRATVLIFYQGDWSPFCSEQLDIVQKAYTTLKKIGFQIVAISPDTPHKLVKSRKKKHLNYILLSDYYLEAARSFGLAYRVSAEEAKKLKKKYGAELRHIKGEEMYNLPVPGAFIVDTSGKIHFQYVNPDFEYQLSPGLLIEAAKMVAINTNMKPYTHNKN